MKKSLVFALFLVVFGAFVSAHAQQAGSVAIASHIDSSGDKIIPDYTKCVSDLKGLGAKIEDAMKNCKETAKIASHTITRVANEAADATKSSRPVVVNSGYGYGGYGNGTTTVIVPNTSSTGTNSGRSPAIERSHLMDWRDRR
jgi:hypothetical protein